LLFYQISLRKDVTKLLMAHTHVGTKNLNFQMEKYVFKRKSDGTHIINLHKTWEKISLAARMIVAIENPKDVCAISGSTFGQRAVLKFSTHVGATPIAGLSELYLGLTFRPLHPWYLHQSDPACIPGAPSFDRLRPHR
jgi:ribosomal protein uS2